MDLFEFTHCFCLLKPTVLNSRPLLLAQARCVELSAASLVHGLDQHLLSVGSLVSHPPVYSALPLTYFSPNASNLSVCISLEFAAPLRQLT